MRTISPSIPEKTFFATALSSSLRLDGRSLPQSRPVTITFGSDLGTVDISLGGRGVNGELYDETRVLAVVEANMVRPTPERPYEGVLNINAEMGPMAGVEYEAGRYLLSLI
jgi:exosome complex component RRP45